MAALAHFRIFPSPVVATEIDLTKPQLSNYQRRSSELKGVDFRLGQSTTTPTTTPPKNRSSSNIFTRSQSPCPQSTQSTQGTTKDRLHRRKRSSVPDLRNIFRSSDSNKSNVSLDNASLPSKPTLALRIPSSVYSASTYNDTASEVRSTPATATTTNTGTPQTDYGYSVNSATSNSTSIQSFPVRSHSLRSGVSATSKNFSKRLPIIPASPEDQRDNRSIFPQYDYSKPLSQQKYYPPPPSAATTAVVAPRYADEKAMQPLQSALKRKDSAVMIERGYECLPEPDNDDMLRLWTASTRLGACGGRKTHLQLHQGSGMSYSIGDVSCPLFAARIDRPKDKGAATALSITKTNPQSREAHILANMGLPIKSRSQASYGTDNTHVFPHQAAVDALTAASNSPQAAEIARVDPRATSRAAEILAKEAVNDAHRSYTSELVRTTRRQGTVSRVDYKLQHCLAGNMAITVTQPPTPSYTSTTRLRVVLHHPSATQAAISAESLAILSIDFGRRACVIDLPGILGLEADYMLDTAIAAVFATAAMEQEDIVPPETMVFAAPPTTAVNDKTKKIRSKLLKSDKSAKNQDNKSRSGFWPLRKTGVAELDERVDDMPPFAKTAVATVELGLHGAFWLMEKGAKTLDERSRGRF